MTEYKHKSIQKLNELYQEHKDEMVKGFGMEALMWRAISPSVPEYFKALDEDEELLGKIKDFLGAIMDALREDTESIGKAEKAPKSKPKRK